MKGTHKKIEAKQVYERIKTVTGVATQIQIADILEIRQSSISDAMRREVIPDSWVVRLFNVYGVNPDWLLYGVGPRYLRKHGEYGIFASDDSAIAPSSSCGSLGIPCTLSVENADGAENNLLVVPTSFLAPGRTYTAFRMPDRSMEPLVPMGAYCGVSHFAPDAPLVPVDGGLYVLRMPNQLILRRCRLSQETEGEFHFHAMREEAFPPRVFDRETLLDICHGRVEFVIGRLENC